MSNIERSKGDTWRVVAKGFLVGLVKKKCYFLWSENIFASFTGSQCAWGMSMSMVASPLKEPDQSELWASYNSSSPPFFTTSAQRCRIMGWYKCDQPSCVFNHNSKSSHSIQETIRISFMHLAVRSSPWLDPFLIEMSCQCERQSSIRTFNLDSAWKNSYSINQSTFMMIIIE